MIDALVNAVKGIIMFTIGYLLLLVFMPYVGVGVYYIGRFVGYFFYPIKFLSNFIYTPSWIYALWASFPFIFVGFILFRLGIKIFSNSGK